MLMLLGLLFVSDNSCHPATQQNNFCFLALRLLLLLPLLVFLGCVSLLAPMLWWSRRCERPVDEGAAAHPVGIFRLVEEREGYERAAQGFFRTESIWGVSRFLACPSVGRPGCLGLRDREGFRWGLFPLALCSSWGSWSCALLF